MKIKQIIQKIDGQHQLRKVSVQMPIIKEDNDFETDKYCTCDKYTYEEDYCPYAEEIHGEEQTCNCCPYCRNECAENI